MDSLNNPLPAMQVQESSAPHQANNIWSYVCPSCGRRETVSRAPEGQVQVRCRCGQLLVVSPGH
jgi:DNA-directed RNA polymerase subunit RPC12/RpoP